MILNKHKHILIISSVNYIVSIIPSFNLLIKSRVLISNHEIATNQ